MINQLLNAVNPCTILCLYFIFPWTIEKDTCQGEFVTFSWESIRESHDSHVITVADTALHSSSRFVAIRGGQVANYMRDLASAVSTDWSNTRRGCITSTCSRYRGDSLPQPSATVCHPIARPKPRCLCFHGSCIRDSSTRPRHYSTCSRYKDPIGPIHSGWFQTCGCTSTPFGWFVA